MPSLCKYLQLTISILFISSVEGVPLPSSSFRTVSEFTSVNKRSEELQPALPSSYPFKIIPGPAGVYKRKADLDARSSSPYSNYIVMFKETASSKKHDLHKKWLEGVIQKRSAGIFGLKKFFGKDETIGGIKGFFPSKKGYYGTFSKAEIRHIESNPDVAYVELDHKDKIQYTERHSPVPWGLSRISRHDYPIQDTPDMDDYAFKYPAGSNVTIYVIDSGVSDTHKELQGKVRHGPNFVDDNNKDPNGHGTHIAGIAAGRMVGVAPGADVVSVKVINEANAAPISSTIQAIEWVIEDVKANPWRKAVINYSAIGPISRARQDAIESAIRAGIMVVTGAGNDSQDSCNFGPANLGQSHSSLITVAAIDYENRPAPFTNYGKCVSVYAPGVFILSASHLFDDAYVYMSGTSMAAPHVTGLVAYYWSLRPTYKKLKIKQLIINSNKDKVVGNLHDTPNKIAFNKITENF